MPEPSAVEDPRIPIAKRIAAVVGVIVFCIFSGTAVLGYIYFTTDRPVRETFGATPSAGHVQEAPSHANEAATQ